MSNQTRNSLRQDDAGNRRQEGRQRSNQQWQDQPHNQGQYNNPQWRERNEDRDFNQQWRPFDSQQSFSQTPGEHRYSGPQNRQYEPGGQGYNDTYGSSYNRRNTDGYEWEPGSDRSNQYSGEEYRNDDTQGDYSDRYQSRDNNSGQYGRNMQGSRQQGRDYDRGQSYGNQGYDRYRGDNQQNYQAQRDSNYNTGGQDYLSNHGSQFRPDSSSQQGNYGSRPQQRYDNGYGRQGNPGAGSQWQNTGGYGNQYGQDSQWQQSSNQESNKHRGRGPRGYTRSDSRITEDINDRLSDDDMLDASDIEVKVTNGEVILSGTVDNKQNKRYAEDIVEAVSGVKDVENRLRVKSKSEGQDSGGSPESRSVNNSANNTTGNNANNTTGSTDKSNKAKATQE